MKKKKLLLMLLVTLGVVMLAACGKESESVTEDVIEQTEEPIEQAEEQTEEADVVSDESEPDIALDEESDDNYYCVWTGESKATVETFAKEVQELIIAQNWNGLEAYCGFPMYVDGNEIASFDELMSNIEQYGVREEFFAAVENESCVDMFSNSQGAMFADGEVWISSVYNDDKELEIKVITFNSFLNK